MFMVNDREFTGERDTFHSFFQDNTVSDVIGDQEIGENGDAKPLGHRLDNGLRADALPGSLKIKLCCSSSANGTASLDARG